MLVRVGLATALCCLIAGLLPVDGAAVGEVPGVRIDTKVGADSVTVGELLRVVHRVSYPDSLEILPPDAFDPGTCRMISAVWRDGAAEREEKRFSKEAVLEVMTTDLEAAFMPAARFGFVTPAGDTLVARARAVDVPVRHIASDAAEPNPLKPQWEAPRGYMWLLFVAAAVVLAVLAIWLWKKRKKSEVVVPPKPELPPDFVALRRLDEIERMGLLDKGEIKKHYTLVVDTLRTYVEKRYGVLAMDETTEELLADLNRSQIAVDGLESVLREADLVKFAKHRPEIPAANGLVDLVRGIVARTAPRPLAPEPAAEAAAD